MGVLNWVHNRMYGTQSKKKTEFSAAAETSIGLHHTCEPDSSWTTAMLSIGTFGTRERQALKRLDGVDELKNLQEELRLLMRGGGVNTAEETKRPHHLHKCLLKCTSLSEQNGDTIKSRSIRKPLTSAFSGFMPRGPRPSFREPVPEVRLNEIIWGLLHKTTLPESSTFPEHAIRDDRVVQMPQKVNAGVHEETSKWIRTDSEYIVLEI